MRELRQLRLDKVPGVAETIDWATALANLHIEHLDKETVESTLGIILKDCHTDVGAGNVPPCVEVSKLVIMVAQI
jgi:hypothetical protein